MLNHSNAITIAKARIRRSELYRWRGGLICLAVAVIAFFLYVVPAVTNLRALSPAMEASK